MNFTRTLRLVVISTMILLLTSKTTFSQDLLVTNTNDSINCIIDGPKGSFLLYKVLEEGKIVSKAIRIDNVTFSAKNYYKYDISKQVTLKNKINNRTVFNVGFEYTNLYKFFDEGKTPELNSYLKDLSTNYAAHLEIHYLLTKRIGIGFRYNLYNSSAREDSMPYVNYGSTYYLNFKDDLTIHTFSPEIIFRTPIYKDFYVLRLSLGPDFNLYSNPYSINGYDYEVKSTKYGYSFGVTNEFILSDNIGFTVFARYSNAIINKIDFIENGNSSEINLTGFEKININRYSIGASILIR